MTRARTPSHQCMTCGSLFSGRPGASCSWCDERLRRLMLPVDDNIRKATGQKRCGGKWYRAFPVEDSDETYRISLGGEP